MATSPVIEAFPKRPLALAPDQAGARRRRLWLLVVIAIALVAAWFGWRDWARAQLRADLRERGVEAKVLEAEGRCWSRRQITGDRPMGCIYDIAYRLRPEHGGEVRRGEARLAERILVFAPPALYDPEDPDRVMFKPEVERAPDHVSGTITWAVLLLFPAGALLLWLATGRGALARAAAYPRPAIVEIDRIERKAADQLDVWFVRPDGGPLGMNSFRAGSAPLLVRPPPESPPDTRWALALLTPKGAPVLLDEALAMVELTDAERDAIRRAAQS